MRHLFSVDQANQMWKNKKTKIKKEQNKKRSEKWKFFVVFDAGYE